MDVNMDVNIHPYISICNKFIIACKESNFGTIKYILDNYIYNLMKIDYYSYINYYNYNGYEKKITNNIFNTFTIYDKIIYESCSTGQLDIIKYLLEYNKKNIIKYNIHMHQDIMFNIASSNNHNKIIEYLLIYCEEIYDAYNINGNKCELLFNACINGNINIVKQLIKYCENRKEIINIHIEDDKIFKNVIYYKYLDILQYLVEYTEKMNSKFNKIISISIFYDIQDNHIYRHVNIIKYLIFLIKHNYNNTYLKYNRLSNFFKDIFINKNVVNKNYNCGYVYNNQIICCDKIVEIYEMNYILFFNNL